MSIQRRGHTLIIEDSVWDRLLEHSTNRGESASQFTNIVLKDALGLLPHDGPAREYVPGDIFASGSVDPARELLRLASADYTMEQASHENSLEAKLGSIGFKPPLVQTVHPGDPYEDIDLGETTHGDYTKVPEHGLVSQSEVPEDEAEF
jgi:hypothetical protein